MAVTRAQRLNAGDKVERFEVVRLLGSGGMGAVYEAHDPELDRKKCGHR